MQARREYRGEPNDTVDPEGYWVELRDSIMSTECNPFDAYNFLEAVNNCDDQMDLIAKLVKDERFAEAGEELKKISQIYWESIANEKADERLTAYINERLEDERFSDFDAA